MLIIENLYKKFIQDGEIYLKIKVRPGASRSEVKNIMEDGTVKIDISAAPSRGKANQELIKFLASLFRTSKNNIKIISGASERLKIIKIN